MWYQWNVVILVVVRSDLGETLWFPNASWHRNNNNNNTVTVRKTSCFWLKTNQCCCYKMRKPAKLPVCRLTSSLLTSYNQWRRVAAVDATSCVLLVYSLDSYVCRVGSSSELLRPFSTPARCSMWPEPRLAWLTGGGRGVSEDVSRSGDLFE